MKNISGCFRVLGSSGCYYQWGFMEIKSFLKICLIILAIFSSCNTDKTEYRYYPNGNLQVKFIEDNNGSRYTELYYENGNLQLKGYMDKDSVGYIEHFDTNGQFMGRCDDVKNTIMNGICKYYFSNGKIFKILSYKNNKANGIQISYDSIGNIVDKEMMIDDKKVGGQYYFRNGEIHRYEYHYLESGQKFVIHYFSKDSFIPEGRFPELYIKSNGSNIKDTCYLFLNFPMPPDFKKESCKFYFKNSGYDSIIINDTISKLSSYGVKIVYNNNICLDTLIGEITYKHKYNGLEIVAPSLYYYINRCDTLSHFEWDIDRIDTIVHYKRQ